MSTRSHAEYCTHDVCSRPMWGQCDILSNPKYKPAVEPPHEPHSTAEEIDALLVQLVEDCHGIAMEQFMSVVDKNPAFERTKAKLLRLQAEAEYKGGRKMLRRMVTKGYLDDVTAIAWLTLLDAELLKSSRTEVTK